MTESSAQLQGKHDKMKSSASTSTSTNWLHKSASGYYYINLFDPDNENWSEYYPLRTVWRKLRIEGQPQPGDTQIIVDLTDLSFADSNGHTSNNHNLTSIEWGIGADCRHGSAGSSYKLSLLGTPFRLQDTQPTYSTGSGWNAHGSASCSQQQKVCSGGPCGGRCGYCGFGHAGTVTEVTLLIDDQSAFDNALSTNISSGHGDPHITNMNGERFDLYRQGKVPLLKLPADTAEYVKVDALTERRYQRTCKYDLYFSEMEVSGSWFNKTIQVKTEKTANATGGFPFLVTVDGQPFTAKHAKMGKRSEMNAFAMTMSSSLHTGNQAWRSTEKVLIDAKNIGIEIEQHRGRRRPISYLNINVKGLPQLLKTMRIGGLLGEDDHKYWSDGEKCTEKSFAKQRTDANEEIITSSASAFLSEPISGMISD